MKKTLLMAACALLLASCSATLPEKPPTTVTNPQMIELYYQARGGDIASLYKIKSYYEQGINGFPVSESKAMDCLENAAIAGDRNAQRLVGIAYMDGKGRWVSDSKARKYLQMAAMQGDSVAEKYLGHLEERLNMENEARAREAMREAERKAFAREMKRQFGY